MSTHGDHRVNGWNPPTAVHHGGVIRLDLAIELRDAGVTWEPAAGDHFAIPDRDLDDETFVLSDMIVGIHELPQGTVIGFNGTTE